MGKNLIQNKIKKYSVLFVGIIYFLSYLLQATASINFGKLLNLAYAEDQLSHTNIVAIFVDDKIYDDIKSDIKRYTQKYIQGESSSTRYNAISNSKAIVMPIDIDNITAPEIVKILENMYFDGISGESTKLAGTILIGDIPLPVINQDGFIYPSIYPYVDFEEQKFIWNDIFQSFVYNNNPYGQAEIWHGIIKFDSIQKYHDYFEKLENYSNSPDDFIGKSIWYDDLIGNKQYFYNEAINSYVNNFMFAEDIGTRRYTDLMVKLLQGAHNDMISDIMSGFDGMDELNAATEEMNTPTMTIRKMVDEGYLKPYTSLIGGKQLDNIVKNVEAANRRVEEYTLSNGTTKTRNALDTHYIKTELKDEVLLRRNGGFDPLFITFNDTLEKILNEKIEQEKYWMNEVIPLSYLKYNSSKKRSPFRPWKFNCMRSTYNAYENYFFGRNAKYISSMKETSTYRGTYRNLDNINGLSIEDIQNSENPSTDIADKIDLNKKSIGGSYDIFATQVDANRGYNINNSISENNIYESAKIAKRSLWKAECNFKFWGICWSKRTWRASTEEGDECIPGQTNLQGGCETPGDFAIRNRGGASPLNLDVPSGWRDGYNFQDAVLPIFDIVGSKEVTAPEREANSFEGVDKYTRLIQKKFVPSGNQYRSKNPDKKPPAPSGLGYDSSMGEDMKFTNWLAIGDPESPSWQYTNPLHTDDINYFDKYNSSATWEGNILKIKNSTANNSCQGDGYIYTYKTIDSRVWNTLTTKDQIGGIEIRYFQNPSSPVKILYEGLKNKIARTNESIDPWKNSFNSTVSGGIAYNIKQLSDHIDQINDNISDIIDYPESSLNGLSSSQIQLLANEWNNAISHQDVEYISGIVTTIKDQFIDLDRFIKGFSYNLISEYLSNQGYNFYINKWHLIFYENWKSTLLNDLNTVLNRYHSLSSDITNAGTNFLNIAKITKTPLIGRNVPLGVKLTAVNDANINSGNAVGCISPYSSLCGAITNTVTELTNYKPDIEDKILELNDFTLDGTELKPFSQTSNKGIISKINSSQANTQHQNVFANINGFQTSNDFDYLEDQAGMDMTTSDRPIDSPKYITFKGVGGDKISFIYPDLYKAEIFTGDNNTLKLKSPEEIADTIKLYLREKVNKYNEYLTGQLAKKNAFYSQNANAYNKLAVHDSLSSPMSSRPYNLMDEDFLIDQLSDKINNNAFFLNQMGGYEPIDFIAHMLYYQNMGWQQRNLGETIQEDMNNIRSDFDVNEKIDHIVSNYLIKDNNQGNFITPGYRDEGYEVAFINSDGADYIEYKDSPAFMQRVNSARNNHIQPTRPNIEENQLDEELQNDCNIPSDGGVMLFDLQTMDSPWATAVQCWREKIKEKPLSFSFDRSSSQGPPITFGNEGDSVGDVIADNLGVNDIQSQYMNQLDLLDPSEDNQEILDNSNPGDYKKLEQIMSYTKIDINNKNINADDGSGFIQISSSVSLGDVNFYVQNVGSSNITISERNEDGTGPTIISNNIRVGADNYSTGNFMIDPFNKKIINLNITNPVDGLNVLVFYMCLPATQHIENCIKKSVKLNIIPGEIESIEIHAPGNNILQGSKLPIKVKGVDHFLNSVGQLIGQSFEISTSTGVLSYKTKTDKQISFSDFDEADFVFNAENLADGTDIHINVDGNIGGNIGTYASYPIHVIKGKVKAYYNNGEILSTNTININLPSENDYGYKDSFNITQTNLNTVPKVSLKLVDNTDELLDLESAIKVSSQNGLVAVGGIESRYITKTQDGMTFEIEQNRFKKGNVHIISGGIVDIYLMPKFKAGEDMITLSMPGIDDIKIPIVINPAPASVIEITTKKAQIATNSNTKANLKIYDNWDNLITQNTVIKLGAIGTVSISGFNGSSAIKNVNGGSFDFEINSKDKGGNGYIYALINNLYLEEQKPGSSNITVQNKILPEEDLNIMYLNLFGSDWGNQWGYMSENNKYVQDLISNSEKLLTTTTELVSPSNIKKFTTIVDHKLQISNIDDKDINLGLNQNNGSIDININDVGIISIENTNSKLKEVNVDEKNIDNIITTLIQNKYNDENILFYLPEQTDSIIESNEIRNNAIYINNTNIFDLDNNISSNGLIMSLSTKQIAKYQIRNLKLDNKKIGRVLIYIGDTNFNIDLFASNPKYDNTNTWIGGSTNNIGLGFYEINSSLPKNTLGYKSIQDSVIPKLDIGFRSDFKNITNFGAGDSVGNATIPFSSEFLINIGDPLLKRIDKNITSKVYDNNGTMIRDTEFDKGLGDVIYSEPGKTILKVKDIDFNNDGLNDVIVAFTDGSVKLLKNYGGKNPFEQIGDLMILADGIKDLIIGDVDGNGYLDIVIWSKSDTFRVYKNNEGVFDVDGYPICLDINTKNGIISDTPQSIKGVFQIFFEDMDQDGSLDIVTNDKLGFIKIFYGGKNNNQHIDNYVSNNKFKCDDQRYQRETYGDNTKIVHRFGIRIDENMHVLDQSLIHWQGIDSEDNVDITPDDLGIDMNAFDQDNITENNIDDIIGEAMGFDVGAAEQGFMTAERYKPSTFGSIPVYEEVEKERDVKYVSIGCITGSDPVKIYKKYKDLSGGVLENGDIVEVSVVLKANDNFVGSFIDHISGPWKIPLMKNGMIENFWFDTGYVNQNTIDNILEFNWRLETKAEYMIDNIHMNAGDTMIFHYRLKYDGDTQTNKIEIKDINGSDYERGANGETGDIMNEYTQDNYPDIKIKPTNGCNKSMFILFNDHTQTNDTKEYIPEYIDLTEILITYSANAQANYNNQMSSITNTLSDNATSGGEPDLSSIPGMGDMLESWNTSEMMGDTFDVDNMISQGGIDLSNVGNAPSQILDSLLGDTMDKVDKLMGGMCDGFKLGDGGGCGLPVPFNQAFLGPGNYHVFGCFDIEPLTQTLGKGRPVLNIPGNRGPTTVGYLPIPGFFGLPFRGPTDGFLGGAQVGSYPSQFRLYLVPTLTAELGIAMCFGPYTVGNAIPDPVSSIGGNCIVVSVPLCNSDDGDNGGPNSSHYRPESFGDLEACKDQNKPCSMLPGEGTSSFEMVSSSDTSTNMTSAVPDGSFAGGFINIEKDPVTEHGYNTPESGIEIDGIKLIGGADTQNKIRGSMAQGLIEKIAKNWLDKQIGYIVNNLTNFKVDIYWPDFSSMLGGALQGGISSSMEEDKKNNCLSEKGIWHETEGKIKAYCEISKEQRCKNRGKEWDASKEKCKTKRSPKQNDDAFGRIDSLGQNSLLDRKSITNISDSSFANPFEKIESMFKDVPLINIRTENITVKVPMITSDDITAYISMSRNWIQTQQKILKDWFDLFKALIGWCGGRKDIEDFADLKDALKELKNNMAAELKAKKESTKKKLDDIKEKMDNASSDEEKLELEKEKQKVEEEADSAEKDITEIATKIEKIKELNTNYDLSYLGNYELYEACDADTFYIMADPNINVEEVVPQDIYISYKPLDDNPLSMATKGYDLIVKSKKRKEVIKYKRNGQNINNDSICRKQRISSHDNQCVDLFLGGQFDLTLNNFLNIQSSTDGLIQSVKQNIEVLELYKKFPIDIYEWIHVLDRYMAEISSIINNFLGTLSLWMKTNASRYSQYVDSLILIMTTIQTYQAIIDLSADWSEKCSSCTNDNYDQFACKLSMICPDNLPILEIPPMKIPSIYIDLSHLNLATDIKLPKFNFVPTGVPLPKLPSIPEPPQIDLSLSTDQALSAGLSLIEGLKIDLGKINLSLNIPAIPVIPEPPDLPELPSFLPSVKMELPVLPPAPKIPKLPNEITAAIKIAETIGKILCIVKGNIGLVGEASIKAKVEQMTQRTYKVPFWDNLDQTLAERTEQGKTKIPGWISDSFAFLKADQFKDVELKGFDLGLDSYVNLQYDFAGFYDFIDQIVGKVNEYSDMPSALMQEGIDDMDEKSRALERRMNACATNPISEECMQGLYTDDVKNTQREFQEAEDKLATMSAVIKNGFKGVKEAMQLISASEDKEDTLIEDIEKFDNSNTLVQEEIDNYKSDLEITTDETRKKELTDNIEDYEDTLAIQNEEKTKKEKELTVVRQKTDELKDKYQSSIDAYEGYLSSYATLLESYNELKNKIAEFIGKATSAVNNTLSSGGNLINSGENLAGEKLKKWQDELKQKMEEFEKKQEVRKEQRKTEIDNLYNSDISPNISFVDYNKELYEKDIKILQDSLYDIKEKSDNNAFKMQIDNYINITKLDTKISPANDEINNIKNKYNKILNQYASDNKLLATTISDDYDKFLYAVSNNNVSLVSNNQIDISLSSSLFDMNKSALDVIKSQDNINKVYLDYNSKKLDGYISAIDKNDANKLNMTQEQYNNNKKYLYSLKNKTTLAYEQINNNGGNNITNYINNNDRLLITQNTTVPQGGSSDASFTDISSYVEGTAIKTPEGSISLADDKYVKEFQGKSLMTDINKDGKNDLILRDRHNIYIKYRGGNEMYAYDEIDYNDNYYEYHISSYNDLLEDSEEGFIKIHDIYIKLCDWNWEIKNFKYNGGNFDSIKVTWMNSMVMGDKPSGYLIKMIHRSDLFNDKESIVTNANKELFDKKYILVLPKGAPMTGTKISLEEGTYRTEDLLSGLIFDVLEYNENNKLINLTIQDIPRNWQYSEIYSLDLYEDSLYLINNSSSNQIVAGPQIIADTKGPEPVITLNRPSINQIIDTGEMFDAYVSTHYILNADWTDNVSIDKLWIADSEGNYLSNIDDINEQTGFISLGGLFFTGSDVHKYYFGAIDINGNSEVTEVTLDIKIPKIEITNVQKYGDAIGDISSPATITAEISNDLDEGYVRFNRYRNDIWQTITGNMGGIDIDKYSLEPYQTIITGGYYDFGNDIGLYLPNGELAVKINPNNGKIYSLNGFENQVKVELDYSSKSPNIKITQNNGNILFVISLPVKELVEIKSDILEVQELHGDTFGDFDGGKAIIDGDNVLIYIGKDGHIYTEGNVYGDYSFDETDQSVKYSFRRTPTGNDLGYIKVKIKNLLGE